MILCKCKNIYIYKYVQRIKKHSHPIQQSRIYLKLILNICSIQCFSSLNNSFSLLNIFSLISDIIYIITYVYYLQLKYSIH